MFDRLTFLCVHQPISTQVKALSVAEVRENMRGPGDRFAGLSIAVEPRRSFLDGPRSAEPKTPTSPTSPRQPGARTWLAHQEAADRAAPKRKRDFGEAFAPPWEPPASERATFWGSPLTTTTGGRGRDSRGCADDGRCGNLLPWSRHMVLDGANIVAREHKAKRRGPLRRIQSRRQLAPRSGVSPMFPQLFEVLMS